jgi:hypothetical protein
VLDIVYILELYCTSTCNTLVIPLYILSTSRPKRYELIPYPNTFSFKAVVTLGYQRDRVVIPIHISNL